MRPYTVKHYPPTVFGMYVRLLRVDAFFIQADLAPQIGTMTRTHMSNCETGAALVPDATVEAYSRFYGIDEEKLRAIRDNDFARYIGTDVLLQRALKARDEKEQEGKDKGWHISQPMAARDNARTLGPAVVAAQLSLPNVNIVQAPTAGLSVDQQSVIFLVALMELAPPPTDKTRKLSWSEHAYALFELCRT